MTRVLEVGQYVNGRRIVRLFETKQRGWRATDEFGRSYYQRGPDSYPDGLLTATDTGLTRSFWPDTTTPARKRIAAVSKSNKRWNAPGRARPDEPLATWCEAAIEGVCKGRATDRHHIIPRGPGSSDEAWNTLDVCGPGGCHEWIHAHGDEARERGFLRRAS